MRKVLVVFLTTLVLTLSMVVLAASDEAHHGLMREVLTSAFDGEPFIAEFNPETGVILFYDMNGELFDWYRDNQTEETFQTLVRANYIAAVQNAESYAEYRETGQITFRNATVHNHKTRRVYTYDMYGNVTIASFDDLPMRGFQHNCNETVTTTVANPSYGFFGLQWRGMFSVLPIDNPRLGPSIGAGWFNAPQFSRLWESAGFDIRINPPAAQPWNLYLHSFHTNQAGDDTHYNFNFRHFSHQYAQRPGEPYQMRMTGSMPGMIGSWPLMTELWFTGPYPNWH